MYFPPFWHNLNNPGPSRHNICFYYYNNKKTYRNEE
ncbi:MAG: hypothetical protein H6Q26_3470, partial [Bacteroidetes bacterium]|nr:hypothetical protein [Bacteroidota bacterium]